MGNHTLGRNIAKPSHQKIFGATYYIYIYIYICIHISLSLSIYIYIIYVCFDTILRTAWKQRFVVQVFVWVSIRCSTWRSELAVLCPYCLDVRRPCNWNQNERFKPRPQSTLTPEFISGFHIYKGETTVFFVLVLWAFLGIAVGKLYTTYHIITIIYHIY